MANTTTGGLMPIRAHRTAVHRTRVSSRRLAEVALQLARDVDQWRPFLVEDPLFRTSLRFLTTDEYDAWLLHWPRETGVDPHDHGRSKGVFTVVSGELTELRWHAGLQRTRGVTPGTLVSIPTGVIHDVLAGDAPALSVHVYSPPLETMSFFDEGGRRVITRSVEGEPAGIVPPRPAHPAYRS
ncbi:MAG: cysteine dioxygenase family protein [Acidimicrobiales bacterium]|nr:cysteine dioxygenase family protein [Acidimicrobiales bacterium]